MFYLHFRSTFLALLLGLLLPVAALPVQAQAPLFLVNENTTVSEVSFKFVESPTFEEGELQQHIATAAPGFMDAVARIFPASLFLAPGVYLFDPVTLAKDEKRLRIFYKENGFLHPQIGYRASQPRHDRQRDPRYLQHRGRTAAHHPGRPVPQPRWRLRREPV